MAATQRATEDLIADCAWGWPEGVRVGDHLKALITKLLTRDPYDRLGRLGARQVQAQPWLSPVDWDKMSRRRYLVCSIPLRLARPARTNRSPAHFFSSRRPMFPRLAERQRGGLRYRCRLTRRPTSPASAFCPRQCTWRPTTASRSGPLFTQRSEQHNLRSSDGWCAPVHIHTRSACFRPTIVISIWGRRCEIEVPRIAQTSPYADG